MNDAITKNYMGIVEDFHRIIDVNHRTINFIQPVIEKFFSELAGINSFRLLSSEVAELLINQYHNDNVFQSLWGSISTEFGFILKMKYGVDTSAFSAEILNYLDLEDDPEARHAGSFTDINILSSRIGTINYGGSEFNNPNDFWIICYFFMRLTMMHSEMYQSFIRDCEEAIAKIGKAPERKPKPAQQ